MKIQNLLRAILIAIIISSLLNFETALGMGQVTLTVKNPDPYTGNLSWFIYEKEAGQSIEDIALLKNFGNEPSTVTVYPVDALSSETGSFILSFPEATQKNIGSWTTIKKKTLTIGPHDTAEIPFEINIPSGTSPGEYIGGIVVENGVTQTPQTTENDKNTTNVAVKTRIGTRIYLTIPGDVIEDIRTKDIQIKTDLHGIIKFHFNIENKGNVSHSPKAHIEIYDSSGKLYETIDEYLGTSAPLSTIRPIIKMKKKPLIGNFTTKIALTYFNTTAKGELHSAANSEIKEIKFTIIPWKLILILLFIAGLTVGAIYITKRKKQLFFDNSENITIRESDNLMSIANERKIKWKTLAKYNKLKAPYILKKGDALIVPKKQTKNK